MHDELKLEACPFCGQQPHTDRSGPNEYDIECYCRAGVIICGPTRPTLEEAAAAWNTRTPHSANTGADLERVALEDCRTHRDAWRGAIVGARNTAQVSPPDIDDRSYWQHELDVFDRTFAALSLTRPAPIPMLLFCPKCGLKHVDEPDPDGVTSVEMSGRESRWDNPPHRSHLCHGCGTIWRPADVPTNGVARIETTGKADTIDLNPVDSLTRTAGGEEVEKAFAQGAGWLAAQISDLGSCAKPPALPKEGEEDAPSGAVTHAKRSLALSSLPVRSGEVERLREALEPFAYMALSIRDDLPDDFQAGITDPGVFLLTLGHLRAARAALATRQQVKEACPACGGRGGLTGTSAIHGEQDADCGTCDGTGRAALTPTEGSGPPIDASVTSG